MRGGRSAVSGKMKRDRKVGLRGHLEFDGIAVDLRPRRQHNRSAAAKSQCATAARTDGVAFGMPRTWADSIRRGIAERIDNATRTAWRQSAPGNHAQRLRAEALRPGCG